MSPISHWVSPISLQVCNEGITTYADQMFDLADELAWKLSEEIKKLQQLLDQFEKLTELRPDFKTDNGD